MTDDATDELLSRYLDDDLDAAERERCEQRLAAEPALRAALAGLEQTRTALSDLAAAMAPPAALDTLLEPLRRGRSSPRPARSLMLALSAAACLVIGVVIVRDLRRDLQVPAHEPGHPPQVAVGPGAGERYYQMKALPTAAPDARALGAADRLLASPAPPIEVPATAPEPLQVYGPLSAAEHEREAAPRHDAPAASRDVMGQDDGRALAAAPTRARDQSTFRRRAQPPDRHLAFEVNGAMVAERTGLPPAMVEGRFPVTVTVRDGRVVACTTSAGAGDPLNDMVCAAVASLPVSGMTAGTFNGVVVISTVAP